MHQKKDNEVHAHVSITTNNLNHVITISHTKALTSTSTHAFLWLTSLLVHHLVVIIVVFLLCCRLLFRRNLRELARALLFEGCERFLQMLFAFLYTFLVLAFPSHLHVTRTQSMWIRVQVKKQKASDKRREGLVWQACSKRQTRQTYSSIAAPLLPPPGPKSS